MWSKPDEALLPYKIDGEKLNRVPQELTQKYAMWWYLKSRVISIIAEINFKLVFKKILVIYEYIWRASSTLSITSNRDPYCLQIDINSSLQSHPVVPFSHPSWIFWVTLSWQSCEIFLNPTNQLSQAWLCWLQVNNPGPFNMLSLNSQLLS